MNKNQQMEDTINFDKARNLSTNSEMQRIQRRFNEFAQGHKMNLDNFKKSMGLLGIGECEVLCDRIFRLITKGKQFTSKDFMNFLRKITYGNKRQKARVSFDFLDQHDRGYIAREDIQIIISEISFAWNFLTGDKLSNSESIDLICSTLGINANRSINFQEYLEVYDNYIEWFDYFNSKIKSQEQVRHPFNIDQLEEYLKMLHGQLKNMITDLRQGEDTQEQTQLNSSLSISQINSSIKGPSHLLLAQELKPRGDVDNPRDSLVYYRASTLSRDIEAEGSTKAEMVTKKLQKISHLSDQLFPQYLQDNKKKHHQQDLMVKTARSKKVANPNMTEPEEQRKNIIYFGHQNWNLMLNAMLGIRKVIKTHFYKFDPQEDFIEEDMICKYTHELIYKQHNKSVKQVCETFVVYAPKVFSFIRRFFEMNDTQFLKSIGLENLIGNMLMGNLSTLTDQTSQGKSGNFIYYTEDSRMILKQITHDQSKKLREILPEYTDYIRANKQTFLPHIYGLFKLKNKLTNRQIHFIVVNNIFCTNLKIHERYDIKGSTYNRTVKGSEEQLTNVALKDLDLMNNTERTFSMPVQVREKIYKQIVSDSEFLSGHNIIQYSLLVGIHEGECNLQSHTRAFGSKNGRQVFFFGIIDVLTEYSAKKVLENHFLNIFLSDISCLAPDDYNKRFKDFIYKYIFGS